MPRQPHQLYSGIAGEGRGGGCSRTIHNTSYTHHNWSLESYHNTSTKYTGVHCTVDRTPTGRNTSSPQLQSFAMANKVSAFTYRNLKWCPLLPLFKINFLFSTPVSTLAQKEEGHIDNQTFQCQRRLHACATKILSSKRCCRAPNNWWLWSFSQLFQWFNLLKWTMIQIIWSGWARKTKTKQNKQQLYALLRHIDAVWSRVKAERGDPFSTAALSKQKWNGPVAVL